LALQGPDAPASSAQLAQALATAFGVPVDLDLRVVSSSHETVEAAP
jgi:hypothetical protein